MGASANTTLEAKDVVVLDTERRLGDKQQPGSRCFGQLPSARPGFGAF